MYLAIKMIICMYLCIHQLNVFANIQVNAIFKHLDRKKRDSRINFRIFRFACNVCMYVHYGLVYSIVHNGLMRVCSFIL